MQFYTSLLHKYTKLQGGKLSGKVHTEGTTRLSSGRTEFTASLSLANQDILALMGRKTNHTISMLQRLYIAWNAFMANDLFTYASAGAYSFLLSALPVLLMVLVILLRFFNASPDYLMNLLQTNEVFSASFDIRPYFESVMAFKTIGIFEVIIGISIFWMARRFFASIQHGVRIIWRKRGKGKPIKENLVVIAGEALLVILIVIMTLLVSAGNAFFASDLSRQLLSPFVSSLIKNLFRFVPLAIICVFLFLVYLLTPRTRPRTASCISAALSCTIALAVIQALFRTFINMSRYNLVYGILSNVIVLLLEVYVFFFLFLFFAQFIYISQFLDSFVLAQLYLLPAYDDPDPFKQLRRIFFQYPLIFHTRFMRRVPANTVLFAIGDDSTSLFYVWSGHVSIRMPNQVFEAGQGRIFGEFSSLIGGSRTATALTLTDCELLELPASIFQETIEVDGETSRRALRMIADYLRRKNNAEPLSYDEQL